MDTYDGQAYHREIARTLGVTTQMAVAVRLNLSKARWSEVVNGEAGLDSLVLYAEKVGADDLAARLKAVQTDRDATKAHLAQVLTDEINEVLKSVASEPEPATLAE